ncbi:alpha/beta-hydrolase family protein [Novosphingobium sp. PhB165]|uniref:alpha/beta hydrolase n=1 Tax=Novosphingobium sp. PhB165 TaxID=2485105 RepID=UPI001A9D9099|nr:alpha/beta-hydrolase family protein [Novosphingobium sp. PhB165]
MLGLVLGTIFLAASLTPSLAPRPPVLLGLLGGTSFAMGYLLSLALIHVWHYMGLPVRRVPPRATQVILILCAILAAAYLWLSINWQNDVRVVLHMQPLSHWQLISTCIVALVSFAVLFALGLLARTLFRRLTLWLDRYLPRRVAIPLGVLIVALLFWSMITGIVFKAGLHLADASFSELDSLIEPDLAPPTAPLQVGSADSLITWEELGRQGRQYIASGPSQNQIALFTGAPASQPIRVYAGLNSARNVDERANLALAELKRVGGFNKSILVVIAPTGTGWIDSAAIDSLEYLQHGDVASVAIQYSYLASWLSLLVEPNYGSDSARAMFRKVYDYWKTLPREHRPRLYLYGLSLGALSSESSLDLFDMINDPIQGALWAGPPFPSPLWQSTTRNRQPDSPSWLPRFRDSSVVRFTNQQDHLTIPGASWSRMRIVYLQYGSDPITFFTPSSFYRQPEWMIGKRAPDVSPTFRWVPGVTFLQLSVDMITGMETPPGFGHVFAADDYVNAWVAVTQPAGWNEASLQRLSQDLNARQRPDQTQAQP